MLDTKKKDELELKVKKRVRIIYNFVKSDVIKEQLISDMINFPGTDDSLINAQYYGNIDLFKRYIDLQKKEEKKQKLQQELMDTIAGQKVEVLPEIANKFSIETLKNFSEKTGRAEKLVALEELLKAHNILSVNGHLALMKDEDFFSHGEIVKRKMRRMFRKLFAMN